MPTGIAIADPSLTWKAQKPAPSDTLVATTQGTQAEGTLLLSVAVFLVVVVMLLDTLADSPAISDLVASYTIDIVDAINYDHISKLHSPLCYVQ